MAGHPSIGWRRWRRRLRKALIIALAVVAAMVALAPSLVPSWYLARALRGSLEASLGRRVHVGRCRLGWFSGLTVDELWIASADGGPGEHLLQVQDLRLDYQPWELVRAAGSSAPLLGRVTIGTLVVRLVRDAEGRLDVPESSGAPPDFKSIHVLDGDVHFIDRRTGARRVLSGLRVALGRLEGSQELYVTAGGRLLLPDAEGAAPKRIVSLSGLLSHVDLGNPGGITGGCDVDWEGVDLGTVLASLGAGVGDRAAVRAVTDGQASLRIDGPDRIGFEVGVAAPRFVFGAAGARPEVEINRPSLAFVGNYDRLTGRTTLEHLRVFGAGSSIGVAGQLSIDPTGAVDGDLTLDGTLSWTPLKHDVQAVGRALGQLTLAAGTAGIDGIHVVVTDGAATFSGAVDLTRSELAWRPYFEKAAGVPAQLLVDGRADVATGDLSLNRAALRISRPAGDPAADGATVELALTARTVEAAHGQPADRRSVEVNLEVPEVARLPEYVPASGAVVTRFGLGGAVTATATVAPWSPGQPVTVRVDAGGAGFETAPGVGKAPGTAMTLVVTGDLRGEGGVAELKTAELVMGSGTLRWTGSLRADVPAGRIVYDGQVDARGIEEWMRVARPRLPARPFVGLVGNIDGSVRGHVDSGETRIEADLDATLAAVEVSVASGRVETSGRLLTKPLGKAAKVSVQAVYKWVLDGLAVEAAATVDGSVIGVSSQARGVRSALAGGAFVWPPQASTTLTLDSQDVGPLLGYLPAASAVLAPYQPSGGAHGVLTVRAADGLRTRLEADLTQTTYAIPGAAGAGVSKAAGLPQSVAVEVEVPREGLGGLVDVRVTELLATTGTCRFDCRGTVLVDTAALASAGLSRAAIHAVRSVDLGATLTVVQDDRLKAYSRWWRDASERYRFTGRASAGISISGSRTSGKLGLTIDATPAGFEYGEGTRKPAGVEAAFDVAIETTDLAGQLDLTRADLRIADAHASASGTLYRFDRPGSASAAPPLDFVLHLEGGSAQLARLAQLVPLPALRDLEPQGGLEFSLDVARDRYGTEVDEAEFRFREARMTWRGTEVRLDGRLCLGRQRVLADALSVGLGDSQMMVVADVASPLDSPSGEFAITGRMLDLDRVLGVFGLEASQKESPPPAGIPASWPRLSRFFGRMNLRGRLALDRFTWRDDKGVLYDCDTFSSDMEMVKGRFAVPSFKAMLLGGVVIGRLSADMNQTNPVMKTEYAARNLAGGEAIAPLIRQLFPDMTVRGTVSQTHQVEARLFATADRPNYAVGLSQFEATDGTLTGPAAPDWMTGLLPGLKLTTYHFRKMESLSRLRPDGRVENMMLFDGSPYAMYISGHTDADGTADYTLGADLFNSLEQDEPLRQLEQGRVPLLVYAGRIADSQWVNQTVSYKLPHEVAWEVFLQRNLLYKLLRQSGDRRRPDFKPYDFSDKPRP